MAFNASPQYPGSYLGVRATNPPNILYLNFIPTPALWQNLVPGDIALYIPNPSSTVGIRVFMLISVVGNQGTWVEFTSASGDLQHLTGNDLVQVNPDGFGNINIVTLNSTVKVTNTAANTEGIDFGLTNLILGSNASAIAGATLNVGLGFHALNALTAGVANTAVGYNASLSNTTGNANVAVGENALLSNVSSSSNVAIGQQALSSLLSGAGLNVAVGQNALGSLGTGTQNVAIGRSAGLNYNAAESSNILISNSGTAAENNTIRIGTAGQQNRNFQAGIFGVTPAVAGPEVVIVDSNGQLGSTAGGIVTATILAAVSQGMGSNIQYIVTAPGVSLSLPATSIAGDIIRIVGRNTGVANNWIITQGVGQQINMGVTSTTLGAGGSLQSSDGGDCIELMCTTANTIWRAYSSVTAGFIIV